MLILLFVVSGAIFLMSTNDLVSIFLSIELQSYGCAPSEAYVEEIIYIFTYTLLSSIIGLQSWRYSPRVIVCGDANNTPHYIADYKCGNKNGLPQSDIPVSGDGHGQDNKLDTYKVAQLGLNVLSRIVQHLIGKNNVTSDRPCTSNCQQSYTYFYLEDENAQGPKTIISNTYISQPRDLTAYGYSMYLLRGRSFHSSISYTKGSSQKSSILSNHDSSNKDTESLNLEISSDSSMSASSWAKKELNKYKTGEKYNGIINILSNPTFLQACYLEIKSKPGNMSKGITPETLDGINLGWFERIASRIHTGKFKFSPTRRVLIPKPGKTELRPLSVGNPREKIIQKALTVLLEEIWEPKFSENSYGFRPGKSLQQALFQLYRNGSSYQWVIQGDISKCFDKIPHDIIMKRIETVIKCDKTLQLIRKSLTAGYLDPETSKLVRPTEGTPQGSVLSPLLANIVLNELDLSMDKIQNSYEKGKKRSRNKEYDKLTSRIQYLQKSQPGSTDIRTLAMERRNIPSTDLNDPNFKRLMYLRYADDFVILVTGTMDDAKHIKHLVADILLKKCGLELHKDKTAITACREGFLFLGAWCKKISSIKAGLMVNEQGNPSKYRMRMRIEIPVENLIKKLTVNKFVTLKVNGMPSATARKDLVNFSHYEIITFYNQRIQGLISFYGFAANLTSLRKIIMFLHLSCALTLTLKYKLRTKRRVFTKFGRLLGDTDTGAQLNIPTTLKVKHSYSGVNSSDPQSNLKQSRYAKLTKSSLDRRCTICQTSKQVEMHHIRKVKDVKGKIRTGNSTYAQWVGAYLRKQIPLCSYHHDLLHKGDLNYSDMTKIRSHIT